MVTTDIIGGVFQCKCGYEITNILSNMVNSLFICCPAIVLTADSRLGNTYNSTGICLVFKDNTSFMFAVVFVVIECLIKLLRCALFREVVLVGNGQKHAMV